MISRPNLHGNCFLGLSRHGTEGNSSPDTMRESPLPHEQLTTGRSSRSEKAKTFLLLVHLQVDETRNTFQFVLYLRALVAELVRLSLRDVFAVSFQRKKELHISEGYFTVFTTQRMALALVVCMNFDSMKLDSRKRDNLNISK